MRPATHQTSAVLTVAEAWTTCTERGPRNPPVDCVMLHQRRYWSATTIASIGAICSFICSLTTRRLYCWYYCTWLRVMAVSRKTTASLLLRSHLQPPRPRPPPLPLLPLLLPLLGLPLLLLCICACQLSRAPHISWHPKRSLTAMPQTILGTWHHCCC